MRNLPENNRQFICLLLLAGCLLMATATWAAPPRIEATRAMQPPLLDGRMEDGCWEKARSGDLRDLTTGLIPDDATRFKVSADDENIYLWLDCRDGNIADLVNAIKQDDGAVWEDDCIHLMLQPGQQGDGYCHIIINPAGTVWDAWVTQHGLITDAAYESGIKIATDIHDTGWRIEAVIPFANLRIPAKCKNTWGLNVVREKRSAPASVSSWSLDSRIWLREPVNFGSVSGLPEDFSLYAVSISEPVWQVKQPAPVPDSEALAPLEGNLTVPINSLERKIKAQVSATVTLVNGEVLTSDTTSILRPGLQQVTLNFPRCPDGVALCKIQVKDFATGNLLVSSAYSLRMSPQLLQLTLSEPVYRNTIFTQNIPAFVECHLQGYFLPQNLRGTLVRVRVNDGNSDLFVSGMTRLDSKQATTVRLPVKKLAAGSYTVIAELMRKEELLWTNSQPLHVRTPATHEVTLDSSDALRHSSDIFRPWGMLGVTPDQGLNRAGFNTISLPNAWELHQAGQLNEVLEQARKLGLRVLLPPFNEQVPACNAQTTVTVDSRKIDLDAVREFVSQYKENPAILGWLLTTGAQDAQRMAGLFRVYDLLVQIDPMHPCVAISNSPETLAQLRHAADILCLSLPADDAKIGMPVLTLTELNTLLLQARKAAGIKPLWLAPPATRLSQVDPVLTFNAGVPNLNRLRYLNYWALLSGTQGILAQACPQAKMAPGALNAYLELLGPELTMISPVVRDGKLLQKPFSEPRTGAWETAEGLWVIALNNQPVTVQARIKADGIPDTRWRVFAEDRFVYSKYQIIEEEFTPFAVHVYTTARKMPSVPPLDVIERHIRNDVIATEH